MTKKKALQLLIRHAAKNCAGAGQGIRTLPSQKELENVKDAIRKLWREAFGYEMADSDWFNLGL